MPLQLISRNCGFQKLRISEFADSQLKWLTLTFLKDQIEQIYNSRKIREKTENVCWQQKQWRFQNIFVGLKMCCF